MKLILRLAFRASRLLTLTKAEVWGRSYAHLCRKVLNRSP